MVKKKVTKSEAVAAIKSAGRNDLANTMRACLKDGKAYATCRPLVRQKLRLSKSWDNRTKTKTEVIVTNDENEKVNCALVRVACPSDHPCCAAEVIATNDDIENDDAELERETKLGAMSVCRLDYRECRKLAMKKPTVEAKTAEIKCRTSFKTCFSSIYPKANADKKMIEKAKTYGQSTKCERKIGSCKSESKRKWSG